MDRTELRDYARKIARIDATDVTDDDLDVFLDEGFDRVLMHTSWAWTAEINSNNIPYVAGDPLYATADEVSHITSVFDQKNDHELVAVTKNEIDRAIDTIGAHGDPRLYYWNSKKLLLYPNPSSDGFLLVHHRSIKGFPAGDNAEPPFHHVFHRVLVDWTLHRLWEMEEDFEKSKDYRARFEEGLDRMRVWYNTLNEDTPHIYGERSVGALGTNMPFLSDPQPI